MSATGLFYSNEKHPKTQPRRMDFTFQITAAKTVTATPVGADCFSFFDAITQAQIDDYLGSTNELLAALFDATAMGADTFGGIIKMNGQAATAVRLEAKCYSGTGLATVVTRGALGTAGLTASTLETAVGISTSGNLAFKIDFGNTPDLDALTAGMIVVSVWWIAK
jgi:hypothetical protein